MAAPLAQLSCDSQEWSFEIVKATTTIGRRCKSGHSADLILEGSKAISRRGAVIQTAVGEDGRPELSLACVGKNNVHQNGYLLAMGDAPVPLHDGDVVAIGGLELVVAVFAPAPPLAAASAAAEPTEGEGHDAPPAPVVEVSFTQPGTLGMSLADDGGGGVRVLNVQRGTQAEAQGLCEGLFIEAVGDVDVVGLGHDDVVSAIVAHPERPLKMTFSDPKPPAAAEAAPPAASMADTVRLASHVMQAGNAWLSTTWADRQMEYRAHEQELEAKRRAREEKRTEAARSNAYLRSVVQQDRAIGRTAAPVLVQSNSPPSQQQRSSPAAAKRRKQSPARQAVPRRQQSAPRTGTVGRSKSPARGAAKSPSTARPKSPALRKPPLRAASAPRATTPVAIRPTTPGGGPSQAFLNDAMDKLCSGLTSKLKAEEAFRKIDKDNSGELDAREFKLALKYLHLHLNERQIGVLIKHLDKDEDGTISIEEFMHVVFEGKLKTMRKKFQQRSYTMGGHDYEKLFNHYDKNNSGDLSFEDFRKAVRKDVGMKEAAVTDDELREMFDHVDSSGNGFITFDDFANLLAINTEPPTHDRFDSIPGQIFDKILQEAQHKRCNLMGLFNRFDRDDSGGLNREDFRLAMADLGVIITDAQMNEVMDETATQGFISTANFVARMRVAKKDARAAEADGYEVQTKLDQALKPTRSDGPPARKKSPKKARPTTPTARATTPQPIVVARATTPSAAYLTEAMDRLCSGLTSKSVAQTAFWKIDKDNSGELDAREFKLALKYLNLHLNERQIGVLIKHLDKDEDGTISIEEFMHVVFEGKLKVMRKKFQTAAYSIGGVDLEKLFRHYDRDNSGLLDFEEFRRAVRKDVGMTKDEVTDDELQEMFDHVDKDKGGEIDLAEFKELLYVPPEVSFERHDSVPGQVYALMLQEADKKRANLLHLFHRFDKDESGGLERDELKEAMLELGIVLSQEHLDDVMDDIDKSGEGFVSTASFITRMREAKRDARLALKHKHETESTLDVDLSTSKRSKSPARPARSTSKSKRAGTPKKSRPVTPAATTVPAAKTANPAGAFLAETMERLCGKITSKEMARDAFRKIDGDGSGELDAAEFKLALKYLHLHLNERQIDVVMKHLDKDGDGTISLEEFMNIVWENKLKTLRKKFSACAYSIGGVDLDKLFKHYDRDNGGTLSWEEFRSAVRKDVGMKDNKYGVTDDELREMFDHVDKDKGGEIDLAEFKELLYVPPDDFKARYESAAGKVFTKILKHADEKHANLLHLFHRFDADDSGGLEPKEFRDAMMELGIALEKDELNQVMDEMDKDGDGYVSTKEFSDRMRLAKKDMRAKDREEMDRERAEAKAKQKAAKRAASPPAPEEGAQGQGQAVAVVAEADVDAWKRTVSEPAPEPEASRTASASSVSSQLAGQPEESAAFSSALSPVPPATETEAIQTANSWSERSSNHPEEHFNGRHFQTASPSPPQQPPQQQQRAKSPPAGVTGDGFAFAELRCVAESWIYRMTKSSITIGRKGKAGAMADVLLSGSKAISRKHAQISAVAVPGSQELALELACVGKNHVTVNEKLYAADTQGILLRTGDRVKIGGVELEVLVLSQ